MLVPSGWRPIYTIKEGARTPSGPLRVVDLEPCGPPAPLSLDLILKRLAETGFTLVESGAVHATTRRGDTEVSAYLKNGWVAEVLVQFVITRESGLRLEAWESFVTKLAEAFALELVDHDAGMLVNPQNFLALLRRTAAWRTFHPES
jgi:hypothetical protein